MSVDEEAVERFQRRTRSTSLAVLRRNLSAGVYGPTGSPGRAVAERVLEERVAIELPAPGSAADRISRAESLATRAAWVAVAALLLAALGVIAGLALR